MELADEMGLLIVSEAFDMWERPKTPYDYARYFREWVQRDVKSWVKRDRNHPSLIMWSIGNEIYDTHADARTGHHKNADGGGLYIRSEAKCKGYHRIELYALGECTAVCRYREGSRI